MTERHSISIIVPFYNAENFLRKSLNSVINQDIAKPYEIILVNDSSTDNSVNIIKEFKFNFISILNTIVNSGPAAARNLGIQKAKGEYVCFLDADDTLEKNALSLMYETAKKENSDFVFSDCKWVVNKKNQRENKFSYSKNKILNEREITISMIDRIHNPFFSGQILGTKCKLIKLEFLKNNKIFFDERLRYLEDEIFLWNCLGFLKSANYIKKQLYTYHVNPNVHTGVISGLNKNFNINNFKYIKEQIVLSFSRKGLDKDEYAKLGDQAYIYFIINALISYGKSIIHKKIDKKLGFEIFDKIIYEIFSDKDVNNSIKNYKRSKKENLLIPLSILFRFNFLLKFAVQMRAKKILKLRDNNEI